jgi:GNAT superfamily N-acetyltransferase
MLEEMRADFLGERTGEEFLPFGLYVAGRPVTVGLLVLPLKENLQVAWGTVWTRPEERRQGYGAAMLDRLVEVARERDRTTLTTEVFLPYDAPEDGAGHPDAEFLLSRGFKLDLSNVVRVLDLPVDAAYVQGLADAAAPAHRDYTLRQFRARSPTTSCCRSGSWSAR